MLFHYVFTQENCIHSVGAVHEHRESNDRMKKKMPPIAVLVAKGETNITIKKYGQEK